MLTANEVLESTDLSDIVMVDEDLLGIQEAGRNGHCSCSGRGLPPIGDTYFQNIRSRGVIVMAFVFVFLTAESVAISGQQYWVCFLLLLLVPLLCATFPGTGAAWLAMGWITLSMYHGLFVYDLLNLKRTPENYYVIGYMSTYIGFHQLFYLVMIADVVLTKACRMG